MNKPVETEETGTALVSTDGSGSLAVALSRVDLDQQIATARAFPRSIDRAIKSIISLATLDPETAKSCVYARAVGRDPETGKETIARGPSIRFMEIVADCWGNCRDGARVVHVDRIEKYVEAEGVFHDLETNRQRTMRERKSIATKRGFIYSETQIQVVGKAACSIAVRNAIKACVPIGVWKPALDAVESVIRGDIKTLAERRKIALAEFEKMGISADRVFRALNVVGIEDVDLDDLINLTGFRTAIKSGEASADDLFPEPRKVGEKPKTLDERLDKLAAGAGTPPHDPETGEINESGVRTPDTPDGAAVAPSSEGAGSTAGESSRPNDPAPKSSGAKKPEKPAAEKAAKAQQSGPPTGEAAADQPKTPAAQTGRPEASTAASRHDAILAELKEQGAGKAAEGTAALNEWLDGFTGEENAILTASGLEPEWQKVARAADKSRKSE